MDKKGDLKRKNLIRLGVDIRQEYMWSRYVKQASHGLIWGVLMGKESTADRILYVDRVFYADRILYVDRVFYAYRILYVDRVFYAYRILYAYRKFYTEW